MNQESNDLLVLICGESGSGKSASLRNIRNQGKWLFLNCEAGKKLPFRSKFKEFRITDPYQIYEAFDYAIENPNEVEGIIIDSVTFLMEMFESDYVLKASNGMKAWSDYQQYFKNLMQKYVVKFNKPTILIAHVQETLDEASGTFKCQVPIKGALKGNGVEAYFSQIVYAQKMPIKNLKDYQNEMLHIDPEEEAVGYKHVFQTKVTKSTTGSRIRSPLGLFSTKETFIDNDAQLLMDHLIEYYRD